jgi:hypothetical protein
MCQVHQGRRTSVAIKTKDGVVTSVSCCNYTMKHVKSYHPHYSGVSRGRSTTVLCRHTLHDKSKVGRQDTKEGYE